MSTLGRIARLVVSSRRVLRLTTTINPTGQNVIAKFPTFLSRHLATAAAPSWERRADNRGRNRDAPMTVDARLEQLDEQARRWGRTDNENVQGVLKQMERAGEAPEHQSLMLIRSTGKLMVKETPEKRQQIFADTWRRLEKLGAPKTTALYNAALRVQLENEQQFSATEFLASMGECQPNRVTYQLLIARYCEVGDIEAAIKILEHMKTNRLAISEMVFNSLIKGYLRAGNQEQANEVLQNMRESGMFVSADTYQVMMSCHAEQGNMEGIKQVAKEAQHDEVTLYPRQFLEVAPKLIVNGHSQFLKELLDMMPQNFPFNQDALNTIHQLVARGYDKEALLVYSYMQRNDNGPSTLPQNVIRTMVIAGRSMESIEAMRQEFAVQGHPPPEMSMIAMFALKYHQPRLAMQCFRLMESQDDSLRANYFWSLFQECADKKDTEALYEALHHLNVMIKDNEKYSTAYYNGINKLWGLDEPTDTILQKLKEMNYNAGFIDLVHVLSLAKEGQLQEAKEALKGKSCSLYPALIKSELMRGFRKTNDIQAFAELLCELNTSYPNQLQDTNGFLIENVLKFGGLDAVQTEEFLKTLQEKNVNCYGKYIDSILRSTRAEPLSAQSIETLKAMKSGTPIGQQNMRQRRDVDFVNMSVDETRAELEKGNVNPLAAKKWLLSKYCASGSVTEADALKAELENEGFVFGPELLRQLGFLAANAKKDLTEALKYKQQLEDLYPDFTRYTGLVMKVAMLQMQDNQTQEALNTLRSYVQRPGVDMERDMEVGSGLFMLSHEIMEKSRELKQPAFTRQLLDLLFQHGYVKKGTTGLLAILIRSHMDSDDGDGAVESLKMCLEEYGHCPAFSELSRYFIRKEDPVRLQKVVDLATRTVGEMEVLTYLVLNFIECGKPRQAQKILDTPGLRAIMSVLKSGCNRFVANKMIKEMEQLVNITKGMFAIDRDEMLFQLARVYLNSDEPAKALDVLATYEDEFLTPKPRTLRYIAKALESAGLDVPFQFPDIPADQPSRRPASGDGKSPVVAFFTAEDINGFMQYRQQKADEGTPVTDSELMEGIRYLTRNKKNRSFRTLVDSLLQSQDTETVKKIGQLDMPYNFRIATYTAWASSCIKSNQLDELLSHLKKDPESLRWSLSVSVLQDLEKASPGHFEEAEKMVLGMTETNPEPSHQLLNSYVLAGNMEKAKEFIKNHPQIGQNIHSVTMTRKLSEKNDELGLVALLQLMKDTGLTHRLGPVYAGIIDLKVNNTGPAEFEEPLSYVEQAKQDGLDISRFWATPMMKLEQLLKQNNQPLPWPANTFLPRNTRQAEVYDDSSDSSSSDEEDQRKKQP